MGFRCDNANRQYGLVNYFVMHVNTATEPTTGEIEVSDRILTAPNVITFIRMCFIPVSVALLLDGHNIEAGILFGLTAATDFLDGMVARRTNTVTRLGQILDPFVDRLLIIAAVVSLLVVCLRPVWIVVLVLLRDGYLIIAGGYLMRKKGIRIPVSYLGKVGMWFLCIGFGGLILNIPIWDGLGLCDIAWLPIFNAEPYCAFMWSLYIGLLLSLSVTILYTKRGIDALRALNEETLEDEHARV